VHGTDVPIMFPSGRRDQFAEIGEPIAFLHGKAMAELTTAESPATESENAIRHQPNAEPSDLASRSLGLWTSGIRSRPSACHARQFCRRRSGRVCFVQVRALRRSEMVALSPAETDVVVTS
jgi:hypothetical protein